MPNVDGKEFPYTKKGKADAKKAMKKKKGKKSGKEMKFSADDGGSISGPMNPKRKKVLDEIKANNSKPTPSMRNNTTPPSPKPAGMGAAAGGMAGKLAGGVGSMGAAAGGMGMPPKKPPMPGMKAGGKVRGAGIAKKGVRSCKMR